MVWCHPTIEERDAALIETPGFGEVALTPGDHAKRAERRDEFKMVCSHLLLLDAEGLAYPRFGAVKIASPGIDRAETADCDPDLEMHRAGVHEDFKGVFEQLRCFVVTIHRDEDARECSAVGSGRWVVRSKHLSPDTEGLSGGALTVSRSSRGVS